MPKIHKTLLKPCTPRSPLNLQLQIAAPPTEGMSIRRFSPSPTKFLLPHFYIQTATFVEARVKLVRDRGLDHAVEKEKNLRPLLSLKNLIKFEPSKTLPVSVAAENKTNLNLPIRAVEFIRKYPNIFTEFPSPSDFRRPHVRLTPETLLLDEDEQKVYENCRKETADRLLKLLMLAPEKRLPIFVVDRLKWDLGLPDDYVRTLLPEFPDYFQITPLEKNSNLLALELVCWIKELAVSKLEQRETKEGEYKKGMPLAFSLQYSRGFDLEKKVKKWVDEWQKLPYISPYEDARHLNPKSDIGEKWVVGVLHELFHLFVPKKAEKESVLLIGEQLGLRSAFKRAFSQHPGIFYVSNKIRTSTVVLREAFKRDLLVEKHPLMGIRYQYIHLMNEGKEEKQAADKKLAKNAGGEEDEDENSGEEENDEEEDEIYDSSEESSDDEDDWDTGDNVQFKRGTRRIEQQPIEMKRPPNNLARGKSFGSNDPAVFSRTKSMGRGPSSGLKSPGKPNLQRSDERRSLDNRKQSEQYKS